MKQIFKSYCLFISLLALLAACDHTVTEPAHHEGRIVFYNASTFLSSQLDNTSWLSYVLIDNGRPGITDSTDEQTSTASPFFKGSHGSVPAVNYFPFAPSAHLSQYWLTYMRLDAGMHRFRLLDTLQQAVLDTTFQLNPEKPLSVFFADSATYFSALALEQEETVVPGKARVKLLNLMPDARGGGVVVKVAAQAPLTDSLPYLASTPYLEYPVPEGGRLYLNVYTKSDTTAPLMQGSVEVQAGHSYLVITKGYTRSAVIRPPDGSIILIRSNPKLDIINTF